MQSKKKRVIRTNITKRGQRKAYKKGSVIRPVTTIEDTSIIIKEKVVVSPVFKTKEQERLFAECAAKSMSINSYLKW